MMAVTVHCSMRLILDLRFRSALSGRRMFRFTDSFRSSSGRPTCDSIDRMPGPFMLPDTVSEG